MHYP
jgi:NADPH-dependent curcumin reductase CurA